MVISFEPTRTHGILLTTNAAYHRYTLDVNLTDEQVNHPLIREAEGIVSGTRSAMKPDAFVLSSTLDHGGLVNDYFSYLKEKMTNSDDTNIIRILMDHEHISYEEAKLVIEKKIKQKEDDYITVGKEILNHPELGKDPEVYRWIASLPYCMGGNIAWSQEASLLSSSSVYSY